MPALYLTIWIALGLFVAGEVGRARFPNRRGWPWGASACGLGLALIHTVLSFAIVHRWSHADAVLHTATQTAAVFGTAVGWGIYVNYLFFAVWALDLMTWSAAGRVAARPRGATIALRAFYLVIILNAAVIFAAGGRRLLGIVIVGVMVTAWLRPRAHRP